ncbi:NAD(P)-dependent oxidoreductase [Caldovatus sp. SYSU G05006]|uniref:NAD(P)-dependent oxidoreductase n=2 Tax=Caldovatus aquaticus TaxID=2865671 RepID=A0ABS7EX88_9PROT|nr:NAD(P)-dependent oxidoreductase [Caldovatus aquaticus]MBW8267980.1 NAD(P)-dependent oxidoreductase [Caldovatus aquaticus]
MKGVVGVIGLGIMGGAMARNLRAAGWRVLGFDIAPERRAELAAAGVETAADAVALAREAPVLITSLPSGEALAATVAALSGAGLPRRVVVETSTLALADKLAAERALAAAGHVALDCPLSGTGAQAQARDLVIYASGDAATIAALRPLFLDFGREVHDLGAYGNGSKMKFVANLLVAIHNVASAEAMVLGMKAGLDPRRLVALIGSGAATSRVFELRAPLMAEGRYEPPTMRVSTWQKDMAVIGAFAAELGCPVPLFSATQPVYAAAMAQGLGPQDTAAVCAVLERLAGVARDAPSHQES